VSQPLIDSLAVSLKERSCYVCSLSRTCALRTAIDRILLDLPFFDVDAPSPPPWQWLPVGTARACRFFDYREES